MPTLETELWLPHPREAIFAFFSDVNNLDALTPPWLHFRILTPEVKLQQGVEIAYTLRWRGIPLRWLTEIGVWEPPNRFVDQQQRGPYRRWIHEHTFEETEGGTLMRDRVDYAVPGWFLAPLIQRWVVTPDVERIFAYRLEKMRSLFGVEDPTA